MKTAPTIPQPATPALLDIPLAEFNTKLGTKFGWINNRFGKAQRLTRLNDKKQTINYPGIYTGQGKEYASLLPHEGYGNFSFWDVEGDYDIEWQDNQLQIVEADIGLVLWMNLNQVLASAELRNLETIKEQIIDFFTTARVLRTRFQLTGVTERNAAIYKGYTTKEIDQQYLMHPFAGLRFNGRIRYEKLCKS